MLSISSALKKESVSGAATPACKVKIKLKSGKELVLTQSDLWEGGFVMDDATSGSGSFDIGQVITNRLKLSLNNSEEQYSEYDFLDAEATAWRGGILQDGTTELLQCGSFLVQEQSNPDSSADLTCLDNMCKTEIPYSEVSTVYPATIQVIVQDICNRCGITLATTQIDNGGYVVSTRPNDKALTCRDVLHYAAQISGNFARCDALGRMELRWYNEKTTKHKITAIKSFTPENQDIIITGIQVTDVSDEKQSSLYGEKGYVLEVSDNPLIEAGKAPVVASHLGKKIIGMSFRPLDLTCILDPSAEAGDPAEVTDRKGKTYTCWITNMTYATGRDTKITCDAESPSDRAAVRFSEQTKAIIENRNKIEKERTERELALKNLSKQLAESSGMYITAEKQKDGSTIYYVHDKPTLAESMVVWKLTANALGISTDGGKTYPVGVDASGTAILDKIYTIGLDATHVETGTLDADLVKVINLHLQDISDDQGVTLDATLNGITADVSSKYTELDGKISENASSISLLPDSITSTVKKSYIDPLTTRITDAETSIKQTADSIESKVSKGDIISTINQSAEAITISASKINLKGAVTLTSLDSKLKSTLSDAQAASDTVDDWSYNKDRTEIDGGKVAANTITAEKIAIGDFLNYATVTENDASTLLSDQAIVSSTTHGDWIEKSDKTTGLKYLFVSQLYCINSFTAKDILKFDFNVWCGTAQRVTYGIWFYDGNKTYKTGAWNTVDILAGGNFTNVSGKVEVPSLPVNIKYYHIGFEFEKYGSTSRNCIQKAKVNKISGYLQIGEDGFIDSSGAFQIGSMHSVGELNDDIEFKHAIFVDYGIELLAGNDGASPYIDFHIDGTTYDNTIYDYTARIQNTKESWISIYGLRKGHNDDPAACTVQAGQFQGTFVDLSDRRLKKEINDLNLTEVLDDLMRYRPVSYKYVNGVDNNLHHGLIAQEAQEIADWGLVDDRGQYLAIHYTELIADLIKAMQYSLTEIEKLKFIITA